MEIALSLFAIYIIYKLFSLIVKIIKKYPLLLLIIIITGCIAAEDFLGNETPIFFGIFISILLMCIWGYRANIRARQRIEYFFQHHKEGSLAQIITFVRLDPPLRYYSKSTVRSIMKKLCREGSIIQTSDDEWITMDEFVTQNIICFFTISGRGNLNQINDFVNEKLQTIHYNSENILPLLEQLCIDGAIEQIADNMWITTDEAVKQNTNIQQVHIKLDE